MSRLTADGGYRASSTDVQSPFRVYGPLAHSEAAR